MLSLDKVSPEEILLRYFNDRAVLWSSCRNAGILERLGVAFELFSAETIALLVFDYPGLDEFGDVRGTL